ncbi:MAG: shikimate dehydrogenase family protein, partial [Nitrospinota bacterium]
MIKVLGVLGWPVSHSLSPMMHNKAIEILDLNYQYLPFAVPPEKLESAIRGIRGLGISGVNLTIPHKERVIPFLDSLSPEAEQAGAVNTVCLKGDKLLGHNTDGQGLIKSLKEEGIGDFKKKSVLLFGAGGASRGIAAALVSEGVHKIIISNRSTSKGEKLARLVKTFPNKCIVDTLPLPEISQKEMDSFDLLINTTS